MSSFLYELLTSHLIIIIVKKHFKQRFLGLGKIQNIHFFGTSLDRTGFPVYQGLPQADEAQVIDPSTKESSRQLIF